jgi:hypothetical protein
MIHLSIFSFAFATILVGQVTTYENLAKRSADVKCGVPFVVEGYIAGGLEAKKGDFPW